MTRDSGSALDAAIAQCGIPGAAIAWRHNGAVEAAAAGIANVPADIAVDTHTIFQIGSITKVFTATLLFQLAERGEVALDAPVRRYLPDFRIAGAPAPDTLTVRTLLDYSSGIAGDLFTDFGPGDDALARCIDACADVALVFPPGTMRGYSNVAYSVAGRVIEVVTGCMYEDALRDLLLVPLGLERYAFYRDDIARYRTAVGHVPDGKGGLTVTDTLRLPRSLAPAGASLTLSATDLLRFGLAHLDGGVAVTGERILSMESVMAMRMLRDTPPADSMLATGWAIVPSDRGPIVAASGTTIGQSSFLLLDPASGFAIAILANTAAGAQQLLMTIGVEMLERLGGTRLDLPTPAPLPPPRAVERPERIVGRYTNVTTADVAMEGERLILTLESVDNGSGTPSVQRLWLRPIDADRFAVTDDSGQAAGPTAIFFFMDAPDRASQFALGRQMFGRVDAA